MGPLPPFCNGDNMATYPGQDARRTGAVTAVGVVNLVFGVIGTACGLAFMFLFTMIASLFFGAAKEASKEATTEQAKQATEAAGGLMGLLAGFGAIVGICFIAIAALWIVGGIGVLKRQQWGRILTFVLGALTAILAILSVPGIGQNPGNALLNIAIFGGYTAFVYIILIKNGAEF